MHLSIVAFFFLISTSYAEVVENPGESITWDPSPIDKVVISMGQYHGIQGYDYGDFYINLYINNKKCQIFIQGITTNSQADSSQSGPIRCPIIDERSKIEVQVQEIGQSHWFKVKVVDIYLVNKGQFRAKFNSKKRFSQKTPRVTARKFFDPPSAIKPMEIDCELNDLNGPEGIGCRKERMRYTGVKGQSRYFCDFGCDRVISLSEKEVGNGYRCVTSAILQEKPSFCCIDGPVKDQYQDTQIEGCYEEPTTTLRPWPTPVNPPTYTPPWFKYPIF